MTRGFATIERLYVPRRATSFGEERPLTKALAEWREAGAYVLLGDPGSGKSEAMRQEARVTGGAFITARDFIALGVSDGDAGRTLFIDGLDEMRAGSSPGRAALDEVRSRLKSAAIQRFRISCREHDWRSQADIDALSKVAPNGIVHELHLEPLSPDEQLQILTARPDEVPDAAAFLQQAERLGVGNLFGNPLLLDLTVRALSGAGRPKSRCGIYDLACQSLAVERSDAHREANPPAPGSTERLLDDAGMLCAVLLLTGRTSFSRAPEAEPSVVLWHDLTAALQLHDPRAALASKVFAAAADGTFEPRHRSIAEYLAAKAIAKRVQGGLPLGRVLALMQGGDGGIVEPLRGLLGWLAVHDLSHRRQLIRLDPLAAVLNGDVAAFSTEDKRILLDALGEEARRNQWFRQRHWVSYPFAPLAAADMLDALSSVLSNHSTAPAHQALVDCVLDALIHGEPLPSLTPLLESWVQDPSVFLINRIAALGVLSRYGTLDKSAGRGWLDRLHAGQLEDSDCRLAGLLLSELYPSYVGPEDVLRYWPKAGAVRGNSMLPPFWYHGLTKQSRPQDYAVLADAWPKMKPQARLSHDGELSRLRTAILAGALEHQGDLVDDARLCEWLRIPMDGYGFSKLDHGPDGERVRKWLAARPGRMKAILSREWALTTLDSKTGRRPWWKCSEMLHRAQKPADWLHWLLDQVGKTLDEDLAQYCFSQVANAVMDPPPGYDVPTMEEVEAWVETHRQRWGAADQWLQDAWSSSLDDNWKRDQFLDQRKNLALGDITRQKRRRAMEPYLQAITSGTAPVGLLNDIAGAYEHGYINIKGETPEERVQELLVCDAEFAKRAIDGMAHILSRADLPSAEDVLALHAKGQHHLVRAPALMAARQVHARSPEAVDHWPAALLSTLVTFWLTSGGGEAPAWYERAVKTRPTVVAPLLVHQASRALRQKGSAFYVSLWVLAHQDGHATLARLVLPPLLGGFPLRAGERARRELNASLLGALHLVDDPTASAIVRLKLAQPSMDTTQRACWLVANLPYADDAAQNMARWVGANRRRVEAVGVALHEQGSLGRALKRVHPAAISTLVELLGPITRPDWVTGAHWVGPSHERTDTVRGLVGLLAEDPRHEAAAELARLLALPDLRAWHLLLQYSLVSQRAAAREVSFAHATPGEAALMLANRSPANQADLAALTLDHLLEVEQQVRGSDTYALRHFWEPSSAGSRLPKSENDCRDLLLERLRLRLEPLGIAVVPERRAAAEKRADLRVEFLGAGRTLAAPIEIKKEDHPKLWSAWRDQLQALYTIDPAASGYGVYLVLWFGHKPRASPEGDVPDSAKSLQQLLTQRLDTKDRARLSVLVMDLSLPC